ncbi:MAG: hypothetical protein II767_03355 [Proteobacteria bacterium]|nr:hypothetical protein [Pseudomonadota bacterium]
MVNETKRRLTLMCCAMAALTFSACGGDDSSPSTDDACSKCTADQICEDGECKDKPVENPCDKCGENQTCEDGVCKDKIDEPDPCDACTDGQKCVDKVCKDLCGSEVCTDSQKCVDQVCKNLCGSEVCADDKICDKASQTCVDKPDDYDPCSECTDTEECINQVCKPKDPCANKTCPDNTRCDRDKGGECVEIDPCETVTCGEAQTCIKAKCYDDACLENGVEKDCGEGQVCSKGECVKSGCAGMTCDEGWQCVTGACDSDGKCNGVCVETACLEMFCDEGRSCKGGTCVDNECLDVTCDEGKICSKGDCTYEICLDKDPCASGKFCNAEGACEFITAPAISLDEPEDKTTDESGKNIALALHLNNAPTQEVRIACEVVSESQNKEVEVACEDVVFNADNWQLEQTIGVTGVDDYLKDGDQTYKIKVSTVSEDPDFNELSVESVELTNVDMTQPGFIFSATSLMTYEDQEQEAAKFTIALSSMPSSDVTLTFNSSNPQEGQVSPASVTFTKDNWQEVREITVSGMDDSVQDGNVNYTIFFSPSESNDEDYNEVQPKAIKVTNVDNDVAGVSMNIPEGELVIEEGHDTPILVKLNTQPKNDVTVVVTEEGGTKEVDLENAKVVLTSENWNVGQELHLIGAQDDVIDGDKNVKLKFSISSDDSDYKLDPIEHDALVKDMDKAEIVAMMGDAPIVKEGSSDFVTMSLTLASKPKAKVDVAISVSNPKELNASKQSLSFGQNAWNYPMDVLIKSVDDLVVDGDQKSKVIMTMSSSDKNFNGVTKEFEFVTVDDDKAGFVINSNSASFPENSGSSVGISVRLLSQPTKNVTVAVTSSDSSELTIDSGSSLTFTKDNWNKDQDVTVKVADDTVADGTQTAYAIFKASSQDPNFNGISDTSAVYTIIDNEAPSVVLVAADPTIGFGSPSGTANVSLGVEPKGNVTVKLSTSNSNVITFNPASVTFSANDWNNPKPIKVNVDFNKVAQASLVEWIQATASGDSIYSNIQSNKVNMTLLKVPEVQNFEYSGNVKSVLLPKGSYKLEVWGAQGGGYEDGNTSSGYGGRGGYSVGTLNLNAATTLYVRVGGKGGNATSGVAAGGWNGGGAGYASSSGEPGNGGGGATDIRVAADSLHNRVIVAGGGGGGGEDTGDPYGHGGGWSSVMMNNYGSPYDQYGATHIKGGYNNTSSASFGTGLGTNQGDGGGGGGGWYGGGTYQYSSVGSDTQGGGGGSGFVYDSSSNSVAAVNSVQSITGKAYALGTQYKLVNANTLGGNVSIPAPGGGTEQGHVKNGYARITLVQ